MNEQKHIVILGAGYGGILTAKKLAKKFKKNDDVKITLIDKNSYHTMLTELHEVAAGRVPEEAIRINLAKVFAGRKVDVVLDEIKDIDFDKQQLQGKVANYDYDYLVLGTGSKPTFYGIKGVEENALTLWSYEDAIKIKSHIWQVMGEASVETDPIRRRNLLTFMVIGCGFTGIEMIGELAEWRDRLCKTFTIDPDEVKMYVVDMAPRMLPMFKDKLVEKTEQRLKKMGVEILLESSITEIKENYVCIEGKGCIETHTIIWTAGIEGSDIIKSIDGAVEKKGRGQVQTDSKLHVKGKENVFVVGDNIFYIPEGEERPVPQMVENAEHSSALVAHNVAASIEEKELKDYKPSFHGAMVCIGGRYGVAQLNTKNREFAFHGFMAMFIKHLINLVYFTQVAGFNKVWTYLMHEIFHVEDRRSFVGGLFAKRSPNFWLVPLRVFLGVKWLLEGWHKLPRVMENPNDIFLIPKKAAEAISGASQAAAEPVKEVVEATSAATPLAAENAVEATGKAAEAASQWGEALPVPDFIESMVSWSMDLLFYAPDGGFTPLASIFQTLMVLGEIAVGLCLIAGLFSAVASIASIVMGLMIWSSGMAPIEMLWYMFGGVATIGGSGSTFGLDYFVLPFLKERWKKLKFVKKWYLFTD